MKTKFHLLRVTRHASLTTLAIAAAVIALGASTSQANVLINPGFESGLSGWAWWGNASTPTNHFRSGTNSLSLSGPSGAFQIRSARAGETWTFSGYGLNDALAGDNFALFKIVWFDGPDGTGNPLQPLAGPGARFGANPGIESAQLTNSTPTNTWLLLSASGVAPSNTMSVQLLMIFVQPGAAGGAAWFDDVCASATPWGDALSFDGENDYLMVTNFGYAVPTNEVTVEFWQRVHQVKNQTTFMLNPDESTNRFLACTPWMDGRVYWDYGNNAVDGRLSYLPSKPLANAWQHFAFVARTGAGGFMAIYRNGVLEAYTNRAGTFVPGSYSLNVGQWLAPYGFDGELDDFRIWSVARTAEQIREDMCHPLSGTESNLVAYWKFDDGAGTFASDSATNHFVGRLYEGGALGNGPAWTSSTIPPFIQMADLPGPMDSSAAWGDYDNDGLLDFLLKGIVDRSPGYFPIVQVWRNTGNAFTNVNAGLTEPWGSSIAWGDYDNDGRLDILLTGTTNPTPGSTISQVWRNTGSSFTNINAGLTGISGGSVAWADYDNDGRLDILLAGPSDVDSFGSPTNWIAQVWRNTGSGFTNVNAGLPGVWASAVAWGDYDNDGWLDLLLTGLTNSSIAISEVWRNTGNGFSNVNANLPALYSSSVAWGDYDNDGRLDILLAGLGIAQVWRNTDSGFSDINAGLSGVDQGSVAWGDYDNDGRLDILLTGRSGSSEIAQVWRNTDSGFTQINAGLPGVISGAGVWADYDNDGRLDILLTGQTNFGFSGSIAQVWRNISPVANTPPVAPADLAAVIDGRTVTLSWSAAGDGQSPTNALTYNLRMGTTPGGSEIMSPHADAATGWRRLPAMGNAQHGLNAPLNLPPGVYYWSAQAVDSAFAGSPFATERSFGVGALRLTNVAVAAEAGIRGGSYGDTNVDEAADGYLLVKYQASPLDFARKVYFQFTVANPDLNVDAPAIFAVTTHTNTYRHRTQLWGLGQAYPGFNSDITWNIAQANDTNSNNLLTTGDFIAEPIGPSVLISSTPSATRYFSIPRLGDYLHDNQVTLVLTGAADPNNDPGGLRLQRTNATLQVAVPWPQTISGISAEGSGAVTVNFLGGPANTYVVQTTTNLSAPVWETISTNIAGPSGAWSFTDYSASNRPARFYRSMLR